MGDSERNDEINVPAEFVRPSYDDLVAASEDGESNDGETDPGEGYESEADEAEGAEEGGDASGTDVDEPEQETDPREAKISKSMEELVRRERQLELQAREVKDLQKVFEGLDIDQMKKIAEALKKKDEDALGAMRSLDIDYSQVAPQIMNEMNPTPEMLHKSTTKHVKSLEEKIENLERQRQKEYEQREYEKYRGDVLGSWGDEDRKLVETFTRAVGMTPESLMVNIFHRYYGDEEKILTADEMSATILEEAKERLNAISESGILSSISNPTDEAERKPPRVPKQAGSPAQPSSGGKNVEDMTREEYTNQVIQEMIRERQKQ